MNKGLFLRIAAGATLALGLIGAYIFFKNDGLIYGTLLVGVLSVREYHRMVFSEAEAWISGLLFRLCALGSLAVAVAFAQYQVAEIAALASLFVSLVIIANREHLKNEELLKYLTFGIFGLFYCVWAPLFAVNLIDLDQGELWFLYLLLVVFFGDTFAFFGGLSFGKKRLNPSISPKKTIEGAVTGAVGSLIASVGFALYFYPEASLIPFVIFGVLCGVVAQTGDLVMSLIKRVHNVKDSGRMIPGHGGVLDRVDGVLIACPLVYTFALLMH